MRPPYSPSGHDQQCADRGSREGEPGSVLLFWAEPTRDDVLEVREALGRVRVVAPLRDQQHEHDEGA